MSLLVYCGGKMSRYLSYELPNIIDNELYRREWSISKLAKEAKVGEKMLYHNLRGSSSMSLITALKILKALDYDMTSTEIKFLIEISQQYKKQ